MGRPPLRYDTPGHSLSPRGRERVSLEKIFVLRCNAVGNCHPVNITVWPYHGAILRVANLCFVLIKELNEWLTVERRTADYYEDHARSCRLLQSFSEIAITDLQFIEESDVLNSDHGLTGKVF